MKTTRAVTASRQLTRLFLMLFAIILVVINLLFVVTATNLIYRYADDQAEEVIENGDIPRPKRVKFLSALTTAS